MKAITRFFMIICIIAAISGSLGNPTSSSFSKITDFGAIGDGKSDDTLAFQKAWDDLCASNFPTSTLVIPEGKTFLLGNMKLSGPCKSTNVHIQVLGKIVSKAQDCVSYWIGINNVHNLTIEGSGQIDGSGSSYWKTDSCKPSPTALHFSSCDGLCLSGLTHLNSPRNHISITNSMDVTISDIHIQAPWDSPNTDGIDISKSSNVNIQNSFIATGDDCVAINDGSSYINITEVTCGPGHGISVGSLGKDGSYETVEHVNVERCTFNGTMNGARIKSWQDGTGYAKDISFKQITLIQVQNPIIIDQHYCPQKGKCGDDEGKNAVTVSNVKYIGFQGTYNTSDRAITLDCNDVTGCTDIYMDQLNITSSIIGRAKESFCKNAYGIARSTTVSVPCLSKGTTPSPSPYT